MKPASRSVTVTLYQDRRGKWRWKATAKNGRKIAASEQGYSRRHYCRAKAEAATKGLLVSFA